MKSGMPILATAIAIFTLFAVPFQFAAEVNQSQKNTKHHHYQLIDMGTFGGPESFFNETIPFVSASGELNKGGLAVGGSATSHSVGIITSF